MDIETMIIGSAFLVSGMIVNSIASQPLYLVGTIITFSGIFV